MYMRMHRKLLLIPVLFILIISQESNASLFVMSRKLAEKDNLHEKTIQIAPSPGPVPSVTISSGDVGVDNFGQGSSVDRQAPDTPPKEEPIQSITDERCGISSNRCQDRKNISACLSYAGSGSFLLVQNDGEISVKVNFTILPANITFEDIELLKHQSKKINISANVVGSSSIILNAGNGDCVIHVGSPAPEGTFYRQFSSYERQFSSYAAFVTPINGAYLLFLTALIIGGTWICCKLGKRGLFHEGVPYQELEMGQSESLSAINVETAEGWDQDWDDDWDEKAEKSLAGNHIGNGQANGFTSKSSKTEGWGNDWDD